MSRKREAEQALGRAKQAANDVNEVTRAAVLSGLDTSSRPVERRAFLEALAEIDDPEKIDRVAQAVDDLMRLNIRPVDERAPRRHAARLASWPSPSPAERLTHELTTPWGFRGSILDK